MLAVRAYRSRFKDPGSIRAYLGSHSVRKLQLGAGGVDAEGWLNSDFEPTAGEIFLDVTEPFPLPDGCCSYVLAEHLIEHIPWESGVAMLKECHRVLAPGGKVRIVTPDLARLNQLLAGAQDADAERYLSAKLHLHQWQRNPVAGAYVLNMEHQSFGHQFLYDAATLRKSFELAGFTRVSEHRVSEKTDPVFQEAERRTRAPGSELWIVNDWEAMAVEAER
jgi:predicted SAM-dependent methyltransferase